MNDHDNLHLATPLYTRSQLNLGIPGKGYAETLIYHEDHGFFLHTRTVIVEGDTMATRIVKEMEGDMLPFEDDDVRDWVSNIGPGLVKAEINQVMRDCLTLLAVLKGQG